MRLRRSSFLLILWFYVAAFSASSLPGAEPSSRRLTVVDYFLMLPPDTLEAPPKAWLEGMRAPGSGGVIDTANGYLRCKGDGAQPDFEVALFRYKEDDRPLLALCAGELEGPNSVYLEFFELAPGGAGLRKVSRSIFPVPDRKDRRFELPRHGRTVLVRNTRGKIEHRLVWDGSKFREE